MRAALTDKGLLKAVLLAAALLLAYNFLATVTLIVLLLATGLLFTVVLSAPVEALHARKVPRPAAVLIVVGIVLAALGLGGYLLLPALIDQVAQLVSNLPEAFSRLMDRVREIAQRLGIELGGLGSISSGTVSSIARRVLGGLLGLFGGLSSLLTALIVLVFVPIYLAAAPESAVGWFVRLFPPGRRDKTRRVLSESRSSLLGWLEGRLFSMAVVGVLAGLALYFIGIPGALFLGVFSGLVSFVPILGAIAGAVPPLLLAFAGNPLDFVWVLLAYVVIQQIESNLLTPLVMGEVVSLHPVVVIASVTAFGAAFGVLGALLAVPACVVAGVLIQRLWFEPLEGKDGA
ncbi:AI-2E family transporter [Rubrobacter aplysinae]|uniref:AI-2E family transporter n=1 Tax=Rubrobacter aplysinae TaxID=909625 RepID=UPI00064BE6B6|nr:AI-2E family transporter [Rubrobacter aplysinae]